MKIQTMLQLIAELNELKRFDPPECGCCDQPPTLTELIKAYQDDLIDLPSMN